jgi:glycosyltransferase involved in cell wall biosynthesis
LAKKLNVLFIASWYPTKLATQNGDFIQRHAEAVATKHNVSVIHVITDNRLLKQQHSEIYIKNNVATTIIYVPKQKNIFLKFVVFLNAYLTAIKQLKKIDIVHLNVAYPKGIIALYLKWVKKIPYIITEHWTGYLHPNYLGITFFEKIVTQLIIKQAAYVCPVSNNLKTNMIHFGLKGRYFPIPNVVDCSVFNVQEQSKKNFTIIHVSHMRDDAKNISGILNTVKALQVEIPHLKLHLIGENAHMYSSKINALKLLNVELTEQVPHYKIANYLNNADVFVLFSNYENLPCVILEAFACGVPVIATNVGGISEYFPKNFGTLIEKNNETALFKALLNVYKSTIPIATKTAMHNYVVSNFSQEHICNSFTNLYLKTIKS